MHKMTVFAVIKGQQDKTLGSTSCDKDSLHTFLEYAKLIGAVSLCVHGEWMGRRIDKDNLSFDAFKEFFRL